MSDPSEPTTQTMPVEVDEAKNQKELEEVTGLPETTAETVLPTEEKGESEMSVKEKLQFKRSEVIRMFEALGVLTIDKHSNDELIKDLQNVHIIGKEGFESKEAKKKFSSEELLEAIALYDAIADARKSGALKEAEVVGSTDATKKFTAPEGMRKVEIDEDEDEEDEDESNNAEAKADAAVSGGEEETEDEPEKEKKPVIATEKKKRGRPKGGSKTPNGKPKLPKKGPSSKSTDRWGCREGTSGYKANAVLGKRPKTMQQIVEEAGLSGTVYGHMQKMIKAGHVTKSEEGFSLKK